MDDYKVMDSLTFLSADQVFGDNQLEIFKKEGTEAALTDFSILLGGSTDNPTKIKTNKEGEILGNWWTKTRFHSSRKFDNNRKLNIEIEDGDPRYINKYITIVSREGKKDKVHFMEDENCGGRPAIKYSQIKDLATNVIKNSNNVIEVEYGEYPQTIASEEVASELELLYKTKLLLKTGKKYTSDNWRYSGHLSRYDCFPTDYYREYKYAGKKYIRLVYKKDYYDNEHILSNGKKIQHKQKTYWIEVKPIKWLVDKKSDIAITKKIIFAGEYFDSTYNNSYANETYFEETAVKKFMNKDFAKNIISSYPPLNSNINNKNKNNNNNNNKTIATNTNKPTDFEDKITNILEDIKKYTDNIQDKEAIKNKINNLLENYNNKLDNIKNNQGLSVESTETIKNDLIVKLNIILDNLKNYYENNKNYYQIINDIDKIIDMFNKENEQSIKEENENNNLTKDFNVLINYCIPFLNEEDRKQINEKLLKILNNEKNKLIKYLKSIENFDDNILLKQEEKIDYSNYEEFELSLRTKIHPILTELNTKVNKRDIELEMKQGLNEITDNIYETSKNEMLALYLNEINKIKEEIDNSLIGIKDNKEKYVSKLKEILSKDIDYTKDVTELLKDINNIIISLHKINSKIKEQLQLEEDYNDNRLNVRFK